jgi:hypothetical protein
MTGRPARKLYRLRRTVEPAAAHGAPSNPLRRQFWGVSPRGAKRLLAQQEQEFAHQQQQTQEQIARELAERERLRKEIATLKIRLKTAHDVTESLREKLARERAARAVLAARLLGQPENEQPAAPSSRAAETRLRSVSLSVELQREHNALRDLVSALYRTVAGHHGVPGGLSVAVGSAPAQAASARQTVTGDLPRSDRWHQFLVGKIAGGTLYRKDGTVLIREGDRISEELVVAAEQAGLLFDLFLPMKLPPSDQDL